MDWLGNAGSASSESESEDILDPESIQEQKYSESRRRNQAKKIPRPVVNQGYVSFNSGIADRTVRKKKTVMKRSMFSLDRYNEDKRRVASKIAVLDFLAADLESKDKNESGIITKGHRADLFQARDFGPMRLRG
jgi:hypothetical protein